MVRLRILKFVLPALLLPFVILLILTFRPRPAAIGAAPAAARHSSGPQAEGVEVTEMWSGERRMFFKAREGEIDDEGRLRLEGVERVEVDREAKSPLVLSAERGQVEGTPGKRKMRLEGGIEAGEGSASGVRFFIPVLELDEEAGTARSEGQVRFEGSGYRGTAKGLVYGLGGERPSEVIELSIDGSDGSHVSADRAVFRHDAEDRLELEGNVHVVQGASVIDAARIELERAPGGRPRNALASGGVRCEGLPVAGMASSLRAGRARIEWDDQGRPSRAVAEGRPKLARDAQSLEADALDLARRPGSESWDLEARGNVIGSGRVEGATSRLSADRVVAELDAAGQLLRGEGIGTVRFTGSGTSGEAAHALFDATQGAGVVRLETVAGARPRIARERTRISARTIVTDPRGTKLEAQGQVEASLLSGGRAGAGAGGSSLFTTTEAVHFVADRLDGSPATGAMTFRGTVRGWQGERNLAAEVVELDQKKDELHASTAVTSRFPRPTADPAAPSEFIQVAAERLDYSGVSGRVVYGGTAHVRLSEGWLEGTTLEVDLDGPQGAAREMRMAGDVRFEMRPSGGHGAAVPVTGKGDRLIYSVTDRLVRLFGDAAPASVTQSGPQGGTTHGRVLRYRLDVGSLDVEAEDRDAGRGPEPGG